MYEAKLQCDITRDLIIKQLQLLFPLVSSLKNDS